MSLARILDGKNVPDLGEDDLLGLIPVTWVLDQELTYNPLQLEHTPPPDSHFEIVGEIDQRFAVTLRENVRVITHQEWLENQNQRLPIINLPSGRDPST